ncbi:MULTISPECIES: acyl-CoA thioesterase [unclassified Meridianimarinicoccus]|uniref:acyl-CoA thioesterase n=1 Tax=unclassified Meridianimarinicoccus TaxID=2923344 RepID=UPI0018678E30|nr:acyl-CoA thioesterase [Fluviibacterium sp. MJW13]
MYPFLRMSKEFWKFRKAPPLDILDTHVSHHICWPWDLDMWLEMNNGRVLTLFDLGRLVLAGRTGFVGTLRREGWMMTVAGSSVRYRKRVRVFDRLRMTSRCVGWDEKFLYLEHAMWKGTECTSHVLIRMAVTDRNGLVRTDRVLAAFDRPLPEPQLPDWVRAWAEADALRPWPPMQDTPAHLQARAA